MRANNSYLVAYLLDTTVDKNGNTITYHRDNNGRVLSIEDPYGRLINLTYNSDGLITSETDWAGRSISMTYDSLGNLHTLQNALGDVNTYAYDSTHRMTAVTYPNGGQDAYVYNSSGMVTQFSEDNGVNQQTFNYFGTSPTVTDALGHTNYFEWVSINGAPRITRILDAQQHQTLIEYDQYLNVSKITDPLNHVTRIDRQYWQAPISVPISAPAGGGVVGGGLASMPGYPGEVLSQTVTNAANASAHEDFIVGTFPNSFTDARGNRTSLTYGSGMDVIQVQDAQGVNTSFSYDDRGHLTGVKDGIGNVSAFAYNGTGALTAGTDPLGRTMQLTNDVLDRVTQYHAAGDQTLTIAYDAASNVTQARDTFNNTVSAIYRKGRGRRLPETLTDAMGHQMSLGYDVQGRVTTITNAMNQSTTINYDSKNHLTSIATRNGQNLNLTYDNLDRLTSLTTPEGSLNLSYDALGNLLTAGNYNGSAIGLSYDAVNRVTQDRQTLPNGYSATIGYAFDANGNRTSMSTPWGNFHYTYDSLDRIISLSNPFGQTVTYTYDALGRRTKMSYPNGVTASYSYDQAGQLTQIVHQKIASQSAVAFKTYTYDAAGNRVTIVDSNGSHALTYDALQRLTAANHPATTTLPLQAETFTYDASGNRTSDAARSGYTYDAANRLISDSSFTYTADANGNLISRSSRASGKSTVFVYDSTNHLIQVNGSAGVLASYKYDAAGNRVEKNVGGVITRYVYDVNNVLAILDSNNNVLKLFTDGPGPDSILIMRENAQDYFFHSDALASVDALTDANGEVVERYEYQAFGKAVVQDPQGNVYAQSRIGNSFLFTGHELDSESGLYFMRARYYGPETGRFLQEDSGASINRYVYAANNPIIYSDPSGREAIGALIGGIVGFYVGYRTSNGDLKSTILGGALGALTGFIFPANLFGSTFLGTVMAAGTAGGSSALLANYLMGKGFDGNDTAMGFFTGAEGGAIGGLAAAAGASATAVGVVSGGVTGLMDAARAAHDPTDPPIVRNGHIEIDRHGQGQFKPDVADSCPARGNQ